MGKYVSTGTELYHYGVLGMKWGVCKSEYKSMNKQQRQETRNKVKLILKHIIFLIRTVIYLWFIMTIN